MSTEQNPVVTIKRALWCQVCVPQDWADEQIVAFAEREYPCCTERGWHLVQPGEEGKHLREGAAVVPCEQRPGFVHRVLVA